MGLFFVYEICEWKKIENKYTHEVAYEYTFVSEQGVTYGIEACMYVIQTVKSQHFFMIQNFFVLIENFKFHTLNFPDHIAHSLSK